MGEYAGRAIANTIAGTSTPLTRRPFSYFDKGSLAVIGKARAVAQIGKLKLGGFLAWVLWGLVHIAFLIGFRNRVQVMISWLWNWVVNSRDARLITGDARINVTLPRSSDFVPNSTVAPATASAQPAPEKTSA